MLVIGALLELAWCFGDEKSAAVDKALDQVRDEGALVPSLTLARAHRRTLYDAAYLELAMRHGAELATLDQDLSQAARRMGVLELS